MRAIRCRKFISWESRPVRTRIAPSPCAPIRFKHELALVEAGDGAFCPQTPLPSAPFYMYRIFFPFLHSCYDFYLHSHLYRYMYMYLICISIAICYIQCKFTFSFLALSQPCTCSGFPFRNHPGQVEASGQVWRASWILAGSVRRRNLTNDRCDSYFL